MLVLAAAVALWTAAIGGVVGTTGGATAQVATAGVQTTVGLAAKVVRQVKGKRGSYVRRIELRDEVFQNERIETGAGAAAEIILRDNTRISLGPKSSIVLDNFVYDPVPTRRKVVLSVVGGVFRFVSGQSPSRAYRIKTPVATLGIRGTRFTLVVAFNGASTVSVENGAVMFANLSGDSVMVRPGLSSTIRPPAPDGRQARPSPPAPVPDAVTVTVEKLDSTLAQGQAVVLAAPATPGAAAEPGAAAVGAAPGAAPEGGTLESVPAKALLGALSGSDDGLKALNEYLRGDGAPPEVVARRAVSVVRALKSSPAAGNYEQLLEAADRIARAAANIFQTGTIMRLTIDSKYLVPDKAHAFDMQPPDGELAPGFEEVQPRDGRLAGTGLRGLHRPGGEALTTDGILGIEGFNVKVDNDLWRVNILTEDLGVEKAGGTVIDYFGEELRVNGDSLVFRDTNPQAWSETAFLTNEILDVGTTRPEGAADTEALSAGLVGDVATRSAGVVVMETEVADNQVSLEFLNPNAKNKRKKQTYITGIIIEPVEAEPSIKGFPDLSRLLELEQFIDVEVARLVEDVAPAAGEAEEPLFPNEEEAPSPA